MLPYKPYVKKPIALSERDYEVLGSLHGYVIRKYEGTLVSTEVRLRDPGQCVAALRKARECGVRLIVYALGTAFGEECMAPVDEDFLLGRIR